MQKSLFRKGLVFGIIILFFSINVATSTGDIVEISSFTASKGNILYVGGGGPGNYSKIQDAIDNASDGDIVFVYNGTYNENIYVDKSIDILGEDKETTFISCYIEGPVVDIRADDVSFSNFKIKNTYNYGWGIAIYTNDNIVSECIIDNGARKALEISGGDNNIIENNLIYWGATTGFGIYLNNGFDNIVKNNFLGGFFSTIEIYGGSGKIIDNIINGSNSYGGARNGIEMDSHDKFEIAGNTISCYKDSQGSAIFIETGSHEIHHNIIEYNIIGITAHRLPVDSKNHNIHHNLFRGNNNGISMQDSCFLYRNTFKSNKHHTNFNFRELQIIHVIKSFIIGNYWDRPRILPYKISGVLNYDPYGTITWAMFDWFPAKLPTVNL